MRLKDTFVTQELDGEQLLVETGGRRYYTVSFTLEEF